MGTLANVMTDIVSAIIEGATAPTDFSKTINLNGHESVFVFKSIPSNVPLVKKATLYWANDRDGFLDRVKDLDSFHVEYGMENCLDLYPHSVEYFTLTDEVNIHRGDILVVNINGDLNVFQVC